MEKIPWGRDGDGENFMDWGKFYGDGAGMGTILFTVSLSNIESNFARLFRQQFKRFSDESSTSLLSGVKAGRVHLCRVAGKTV